MKKTLLFLIVCQFAIAQRVAINQIDEFTNEKIIKTDASNGKTWSGSDNIAKGIFNYIYLSNKYTAGNQENIITTLQITTGTMICVGPDSGSIIMLLEDNSKIQFTQISNIDCRTDMVIVNYSTGNTYEDQIKNIETLSKLKINKLRVYTANGSLDFEIKDNKKEIIRNTFQLLLDTIKT